MPRFVIGALWEFKKAGTRGKRPACLRVTRFSEHDAPPRHTRWGYLVRSAVSRLSDSPRRVARLRLRALGDPLPSNTPTRTGTARGQPSTCRSTAVGVVLESGERIPTRPPSHRTGERGTSSSYNTDDVRSSQTARPNTAGAMRPLVQASARDRCSFTATVRHAPARSLHAAGFVSKTADSTRFEYGRRAEAVRPNFLRWRSCGAHTLRFARPELDLDNTIGESRNASSKFTVRSRPIAAPRGYTSTESELPLSRYLDLDNIESGEEGPEGERPKSRPPAVGVPQSVGPRSWPASSAGKTSRTSRVAVGHTAERS
jgi:hypothetical protein